MKQIDYTRITDPDPMDEELVSELEKLSGGQLTAGILLILFAAFIVLAALKLTATFFVYFFDLYR